MPLQLASYTGHGFLPDHPAKNSSTTKHYPPIDWHDMKREIFVVDDNADYQFIFFKLYKAIEKPYPVTFFTNARTLQTRLQRLQFSDAVDFPALIVLDLNMPGMNGLQLLKTLKSRAGNVPTHDIPVVMMSSNFSDQEVVQCYQAGANAVIPKPLDYASLKKLIQAMCRFWVDRQEDLVPEADSARFS
jgi:CheY-like chemotaxis protein